MQRFLTLIGGAALTVFGLPVIAAAGLLTNVSFDRQLDGLADRTTTPLFPSSSHFTGTSIPDSGTLQVTTVNGSQLTANYTFTDNGSVAEFTIETTYTLASYTDAFVEQAGDPGNNIPIAFTTTEPLRYTMQGLNSAITGGDGTALIGMAADLSGPGGVDLQSLNENVVALIGPTSGVLPGGTLYNLIESTVEQSFLPVGGPFPSSIIGNSTFTLELTPVPEPTSLLLFTLGGVWFVAKSIQTRRRRHNGPPQVGG